MWWSLEIRVNYIPLQGKQYSEFFRMFLELHTIRGTEDEQARNFLVLFPIGYLNTILISYTNKVFKDPLELG